MKRMVRGGCCNLRFLFVLCGLCFGLDIKNATGQVKVGKVVKLLEELQTTVTEDGKEEQAVYDKFACWCEKITQKRAEEITAVKADIQRFGTLILELKGSIATKVAEIRGLRADIRKTEENQKAATALRQKENAAYEAERVELQQAIAALESAVLVLKGATSLQQENATSFRHRGSSATGWPKAVGAIQAAIKTVSSPSFIASGKAPLKQLSALSAEVKRYSPQSYTIQGILRDMYNTFTTDLETLTHEESTAARNYEKIMATWHDELQMLQASVTKKEKAKAEDETQLADALQGYEDSEAQLKAMIELFDMTKASCLAKTDEWSTRKAARTEELAAIAQALEILTSDDAKAMFDKAISFLQQTSQSSVDAPLAGASKLLQKAAMQSHSVRLSEFASKVGRQKQKAFGHFDEVIKAIDGLIEIIKDEEARDDELAATCKQQYQDYQSKVADLNWQLEKEQARIDSLTKLLQEKRDEKDRIVIDISGMEGDILDMKTTRTEENSRFLQAKSDDLQAIQLLKDARTVLVDFFDKHNVTLGAVTDTRHTGFVQEMRKNISENAPDARFSTAGSRKGASKSIISFLTQIIEDLESEISSELKAEEAAHLDFEKRLAASNAQLQTLNTTKINLEQTIADRDEELTEATGVHSDLGGELSTEDEQMTELKKTCDQRIAGLSDRKKKRAIESEALLRAKQYLAGSAEVMSDLQVPKRSLREAAPHKRDQQSAQTAKADRRRTNTKR